MSAVVAAPVANKGTCIFKVMSFDVNEIMSISLQYNNVCLVREGSEDLVTVGNDNRTDFI